MARKNQFELRLNNGNILTLNCIKKVYGHNDTLPYNADFKLTDVNGNIIVSGIVYNDGWGGETSMDLSTGKMKDVAVVNAYFMDNLSYDDSRYGFHMNMKLIDVIDCMADVFIANSKLLNNTFVSEDDFLVFLKGENLKFNKVTAK